MKRSASTHSVGALRWLAKKTARTTVALASRGAHAVSEPFVKASSPAVRVLTYHRFGRSSRDPFCVSVESFEQQMRWLAAEHRTVSLDQVIDHVEGRSSMPSGSVLVTIDDGYRSTLEGAAPVLQACGIPAVAFLTTEKIDARSSSRKGGEDEEDPIMNWDEVRRLREAGVEIGSHSRTHRSLARMPAVEASEEARHSRRRLEEETGAAVRAFAYPFGTRADYDASTATCLRQAGYRCAFTSQHGGIHAGADPFELPRVKVEGGEGPGMFRLLVRGELDAWRWIDRTLWRWQQSPMAARAD